MTIFKKIISFIMCIALVTAIPFEVSFASEASDDILLSEYRGLFEALNMELLPPQMAVTRGQFVTSLIDLMDFGAYGTGKQTFSDVSSQNEKLHSAVEYAVGIGAVSAGENFWPDRPITWNEALKITVEALGYGRDAQYRGGYPVGYYAVASSIDLDDGIDTGSEFTTDTMYLLLGNAANTAVKVITSCKTDGDFVIYNLEKDKLFIEAYRGIVHTEGVITASESGYLYDSTQEITGGRVMIDDVEYAVKKGIGCPLGFYVNAYAEKVGNRYVIIYADISDNNVTVVAAGSISDVNSGVIKYFDTNDNEKKIKITSDTVVLYNGKAYENYALSDIRITDGYLEAIDNDSNGSVDVLGIWEASYLLVDYVNVYSNDYDYVFYDKNRKNNIFITPDTNYRSNVALDSIAQGNVLAAYVSKDGGFVRLELLTEAVSGSVTEKSAGGEIFVGGKGYEISAYFNEFYAVQADLGKSVNFIIDSFGKAVAITTAGSASMKYAYVDDMNDTANGLDDSIMLKLFTEDGEVITPKLAQKVTVNSDTKSHREWVGTLTVAKGQLIKYLLNDKGEVCKINTESTTEGIYDAAADGSDILKRFRFANDTTENLVYYKIFGYFVPYFTLNSSTKIFKISLSDTTDEERFSLGTLSFLGNDDRVPANSIRPYNVGVTGVAGALLYTTSEAASTSLSVSSSTALVAGCTSALDEDGNEAFKIKLYGGGRFHDYFIKKDARFLTALTFTADGYPFAVGDLIRYAIDDKGIYMLTAVKDFDGTTQTLLFDSGDNTERHYYFGQIYAEGDGSIAIRKSDGTIVYIPGSLGDVCLVEDDKVFTQPREKVTTYLQMGEECHKILIGCRYSSPSMIYVFK